MGGARTNPSGSRSVVDETSHDQNFKNLFVDFTLAALRLFGGSEGRDVPDDALITAVRQEQLKTRLAQGHHEIDSAFQVDLPNGEREGIVYLMEEETAPKDFSIRRLVHYMLELSELLKTDRIVPIVIFLRSGEVPARIDLGTERALYLTATYIACQLAAMEALEHLESDNIVARILLPCMHAPEGRRVDVVFSALTGVFTLVESAQLQRKYAEFVTIYGALETGERVELQRRLEGAPWRPTMQGWFGEAEARGRAEGRAEGEAKGRAAMVLRLMALKKMSPTPAQRERIERCTDDAEFDRWLERALSETTVEAVLGPPDVPSRH